MLACTVRWCGAREGLRRRWRRRGVCAAARNGERGLKKRERHLERRIGSAAMKSQTAILLFHLLRGRDQQVCWCE